MKSIFLVVCAFSLYCQMATSQYVRPPNYPEKIIEQPITTIPVTPTIISDPPCNSLVQFPSPKPSKTILITDCSPSACQNLADTLQLMIVCNLLQNTQGGKDLALKLAGPVISQLISNPSLPCGCDVTSNPLLSSLAYSAIPNAVTPSVITNSASPNFFPSNIISSAVPSSSFTSNVSPVVPRPACPNNVGTVPVSPCPCSACANPLISSLMNYL